MYALLASTGRQSVHRGLLPTSWEKCTFFRALGDSCAYTHSLPYALSFASCFRTASKLFGVLISLHICSLMPMVHVYYLSKTTHT